MRPGSNVPTDSLAGSVPHRSPVRPHTSPPPPPASSVLAPQTTPGCTSLADTPPPSRSTHTAAASAPSPAIPPDCLSLSQVCSPALPLTISVPSACTRTPASDQSSPPSAPSAQTPLPNRPPKHRTDSSSVPHCEAPQSLPMHASYLPIPPPLA